MKVICSAFLLFGLAGVAIWAAEEPAFPVTPELFIAEFTASEGLTFD